MGSNNLDQVTGGTLDEDSINQVIDALIEEVVPRDASGVPTHRGGDLGTPAIQWDRLFAQRIFLRGIELGGDPEKNLPNEVISGAIRSTSNQPQYLDPSNSNANFTVLATATDLEVDINQALVTVTADITAAATLAPGSNNTCLVDDTTADANAETRTWGEVLGEKESITIDTAGSEITNRVGQFAAFKQGTTEYFMAYIESSTKLSRCYRGFFYDSSGNPFNRLTFVNNDTITLMALNWVFLEDDGATVSVITTTPTWSQAEPSSPATNDRWYDLENQVWKKYNGSAFVQSDETWIGWVVADSTKAVAARCREFAANYKRDNSIVLGNLTNATVEVDRVFSHIRIGNRDIEFGLTRPVWNMANDLAASTEMYNSTEQASRRYYFYISDVGKPIISDIEPYWRGDWQGYFHPHNTWRCVGYARNNASSNLIYFSSFPGLYEDRQKDVVSAASTALGTVSTTYESFGTWTNDAGAGAESATQKFAKRGSWLVHAMVQCTSSDAATKVVDLRVRDTTASSTIYSFPQNTIEGGTTDRTMLSVLGVVDISFLQHNYEMQIAAPSGDITCNNALVTFRRMDRLFI